jgi:translation initiation factor 2 beta subunit (eIF-2beta)/eIF-5
MIQKNLVFLLFLAVLAHGYTEENGILVLEGKDLDTITETFPNLFIEFYVPWYTCGYVGANIAEN